MYLRVCKLVMASIRTNKLVFIIRLEGEDSSKRRDSISEVETVA